MPNIDPECYEGKTAIAAFFERRGIRCEREGNKLFGLRPMFKDKVDGIWQQTFERIEVRTMSEARALDKLIDS